MARPAFPAVPAALPCRPAHLGPPLLARPFWPAPCLPFLWSPLNLLARPRFAARLAGPWFALLVFVWSINRCVAIARSAALALRDPLLCLCVIHCFGSACSACLLCVPAVPFCHIPVWICTHLSHPCTDLRKSRKICPTPAKIENCKVAQ